MSFSKFDAARLYKKLRALEPNVSGALGTPPSGSAVGAVGDVVLVTGAGTTTDVLDARITNTTFMEIAPADLYGSAEKGAGNIFWSSPADGIMRITHTASTKTRTFKYLLMFALALLLASAAAGQVIQDDGTPLEVAPALNFTDEILCTSGPNSTDCGAIVDGSGSFMLVSEYDILGGGGGQVAYAGFADSTKGIDTNVNNLFELFCTVGILCNFDINEDLVFELSVTATDLRADVLQGRFGNGVGVGNASGGSSAATATNSACLGRDSTTAVIDKLFEDKECDYLTNKFPETSGSVTGTTNSEAFVTDMQRRLAATFGPVVAVAGAGVQVTTLKLDLDWIGSYLIEYQLLTQSTVLTTGMSFGVAFSGAFTHLFCRREFVSTGIQIPILPGPFPVGPFGTTGVTDDAAAVLTGSMVEGYASNVASTVTPLLGPNDGVATINSTALETVKCNLLTTAAGDLQLWMTSETGAGVNLMAGSLARATPFP